MSDILSKAEKLSKKNSVLLWIGNWTSTIGNKIFDYANSILILSLKTKATKLLALYQSTETLITIFFNLFGGVMADGSSKKKICVVTDFFGAMLCFSLAMLLQSPYIGMLLIIFNALLACASAFNSPTYKSIIREVICKEKIMSFNSIMHGVNVSIGFFAPVVALITVDYIGVFGALIVDGVTFLVSALLEMYLEPLPEYEIKDVKKMNMLPEIKRGFIYLYSEKWILFLVLMSAGINFFLSAYNLSLPFTENIFGEGWYSKFLIAESIGGILGSYFCTLLKNNKTSINYMILSLGLSGLILLMIPYSLMLSNSKILILFMIVLFSQCMTMYNVNFYTYIQLYVKQEFLGRVFSIINTIALTFVPLGAIFFSYIFSFNSLNVYKIVGIGVIVITCIAFLNKKLFLKKLN